MCIFSQPCHVNPASIHFLDIIAYRRLVQSSLLQRITGDALHTTQTAFIIAWAKAADAERFRLAMPIKFVLLVNKQGQTRLAKYTDVSISVEERRALEGEIVRKCLTRAEKQVLVPLLCPLCAFTSN